MGDHDKENEKNGEWKKPVPKDDKKDDDGKHGKK